MAAVDPFTLGRVPEVDLDEHVTPEAGVPYTQRHTGKGTRIDSTAHRDRGVAAGSVRSVGLRRAAPRS